MTESLDETASRGEADELQVATIKASERQLSSSPLKNECSTAWLTLFTDMPLVSHSNWNSHPSLYTTGMFSGALTKILCPHVQKVVAGCPVGLSLGFFSVPLCNQAVFWVTYQEDCTTVHWLIVQYSFWQLVVREEGCSSSMIFYHKYTRTPDSFTCEALCPQTAITVECTCIYHLQLP